MLILICNAGSTSLKYKLYKLPSEELIVEAKIERIGVPNEGVYSYDNRVTGKKNEQSGINVPGYSEGIGLFLSELVGPNGAVASLDDVDVIGFKTVCAKGYPGVHELTPDVLRGMETYLEIAPMHNACYLSVIRQFQGMYPDKKLMGVFETSFHTTMPKYARMYGVPYDWYERDGIQRFGYHGVSNTFIAPRVKEIAGFDPKLISCHLGGSSSVTAIQDGRSMDSSFGFSTDSGLPHGNRVGDLDILAFVYRMQQGHTLEETLEDLRKNGGLLGISGVSNDMREIEQAANAGNARAQLAIDVLCHEIRKYIGSFYVVLGGVEYLTFTGGMGERSPMIREKVCAGLAHLGVSIDPEKNAGGPDEREISAADSRVKVWIIPANEELAIARQLYLAQSEKQQ